MQSRIFEPSPLIATRLRKTLPSEYGKIGIDHVAPPSREIATPCWVKLSPQIAAMVLPFEEMAQFVQECTPAPSSAAQVTPLSLEVHTSPGLSSTATIPFPALTATIPAGPVVVRRRVFRRKSWIMNSSKSSKSSAKRQSHR